MNRLLQRLLTAIHPFTPPNRGRGPFTRFTRRARKVFVLAQEEAQRLNHNYLGTEHLLLALTYESRDVSADVLRNAGISPLQVREAVLRRLIQGPSLMQ